MGTIPRHNMKEWKHYIEHVYVPVTSHVYLCSGHRASGNEPCPGMLRGKTVWEKPVCLQSSATPPLLPQTRLPVEGLVEGDFHAVAPSGIKQEFLDYLDQCGLIYTFT